MKLPDFFSSAALNALRQGMGIPPDRYGSFNINIDPGKLTPGELNKLTTGEGIDVKFEELTILPDGTLAYKDSRVLVYIRDHHAYQGEIKPPRYHFFNCRTLGEMRRNKRIDKYVVATETTGTFEINIIEGNQTRSERRKLNVCKNCLHQTSFDEFSFSWPEERRNSYVETFLPKRFFEVYSRSFIINKPRYSDITAPLNNYPDDWGQISREARNRANWTCSHCGLRLIVHKKKFLHVHHINGVRSDNRPANLQVLCLGCHSEEPAHQYMKRSAVYKEFLRETGWKPNRRR